MKFLFCAVLPTLRNLLHALRKQSKLACAMPQNVSSNDRHFKYFYSLSSLRPEEKIEFFEFADTRTRSERVKAMSHNAIFAENNIAGCS